ncbi:MAG: fimbria/pilus outer membrane usher protein, partial [Aeromonas sp.]
MRVVTTHPIALLVLFICVIFASPGHANDELELNTDFLHGVTGVPPIFGADSKYPAGQYLVDVKLNGITRTRASLTITQEDALAGNICLSPAWLLDAGVLFNADKYEATFDKKHDCYRLAQDPNTRVEFDYNAQTIDFIIPQAYLIDKSDAANWDYGVNGFHLKYNGNFNKNSDSSLNAFGNMDATVNLERWVLSSNMNATKGLYGNEFTTNDLTLSTAISEIRGDFQLGRSQTRTELFSDFGFYGVALRSNQNMRPRRANGYAPIISGVASSTSRVTVSQGGYIIYSKMVAAGPYQLDDISPVNNGDLVVTVEDDNGATTRTIYPVATLPTLLRPGEYNYNFAIGQKNTSNQLSDALSSGQGIFLLGSLDYGLATNTVNVASILHDNYQAGGIGITQPLGEWGVIASSVNFSNAEYDDSAEQGASFAFKFAKSFNERTNLQLLTYRYQSAGYREFASFDGDKYTDASTEKVRYEAILSHRLDNNVYIGASLWQQSYWGDESDTVGANLSLNTNIFGNTSLYVNSRYSRSAYSDQDEYSTSLGISIPFTFGGLRHYSSNSIGYSKGSGATFNTTVSASVDRRLNYSLNANTNSKGTSGVAASAGYGFDAVQTTLALAQNQDRTTVSGSVSGSA